MNRPNVVKAPPTKHRTMAEHFAAYLRACYPGQTIGGTQYIQLRRAYMAGMWQMLNLRLLGPTETAEFSKEYMAFLADVAQNKA